MLGRCGRGTVGGLDFEVLSWDLPEVSTSPTASVRWRARFEQSEPVAAAAPALVVNCAALVDLEGCERDPDRAWQVNAVGARNVATAAQRCAATLFYISSDYVFDGATDGSYDEVATPNPLNHYGRSKLAAGPRGDRARRPEGLHHRLRQRHRHLAHGVRGGRVGEGARPAPPAPAELSRAECRPCHLRTGTPSG